jgi:diguanylate cyclase
MSRLSTWWAQPDQYDSITAFLRQRGLLRLAQRILAAVAASSALVPLSGLLSQRDQSASTAVINGFAVMFTVATAIVCLTRWPTRRQSQAAIVTGTLLIGGWSLGRPLLPLPS